MTEVLYTTHSFNAKSKHSHSLLIVTLILQCCYLLDMAPEHGGLLLLHPESSGAAYIFGSKQLKSLSCELVHVYCRQEAWKACKLLWLQQE